MNRQPQRAIINQRPAQSRSGRGWAQRVLQFFSLSYFFFGGFILNVVGHLAKPDWDSEDDWCEDEDWCREERLETERNLRNCQIVGQMFLPIGVFWLVVLIRCYRRHVQHKENRGRVITGPPSTQTVSTSQAGPGALPTSQFPADNTFGPQQPYRQAYGYRSGPYPNNLAPPAAGPYPQYPKGQVYPPQTQHPYPPQGGQGYSPYPTTDMPPPPPYESATNQSAVPSARPMEKVD